MTPRGKLIGKVDEGWPTYDTAAALANMKKAVKEYKSLDKTQRLAPRTLKESERSFKRAGYGKARPGTIELVSVSRGLPFKDMQLFDLRNPEYFTIDRLWYAKQELQSLVPENPVKGKVTKANPVVMQRMMQYSHFLVGGLPWNQESFKSLELASKVVKVTKDKVYLTLEGKVEAESDTRWNRTNFSGEILGRIIYSKHAKRFEKFELVSLGKHDLKQLASNVHRGNTTETDVAMVIRLDKRSAFEKEVPPASIQSYPPHLKPENFRNVKW